MKYDTVLSTVVITYKCDTAE